MARSIVWPQVAPPPAAEPAAASPGLDLKALAASLGPELARRMGLRITVNPDAGADLPVEPQIGLGRIPLQPEAQGPDAVRVGCGAAAGAGLLDRLFGAPAGGTPDASGAALLDLPPGSASWLALCRTLMSAFAMALGAAGRTVAGSPVLPARPTTMDVANGIGLVLDVDGIAWRLVLVPEHAKAAAPETVTQDVAAFRQAARARALDLELPVALRVAERRISLAQASALTVGDIIPIDPLPMPDVLAAGRRVARLPASAFAIRRETEDGQ